MTTLLISRMDSLVASTTEIVGSSSIIRSTFSTTTIASSTSNPIDNTIANMVNTFTVKPSTYKIANVPNNTTGTARVGIMVARQLCKNSNITKNTNPIASIKVCMTCLIDNRTNGVVSYGVTTLMPAGKLDFSWLILASTAARVSRAFAPVASDIAIPAASLPL